MTQELPHPSLHPSLFHLPVYYCNIYRVDWHPSPLRTPACALSHYNAAVSDERFSQCAIITCPLYCIKVFCEPEQLSTIFYRISWHSCDEQSCQDWGTLSVDEKMKAAFPILWETYIIILITTFSCLCMRHAFNSQWDVGYVCRYVQSTKKDTRKTVASRFPAACTMIKWGLWKRQSERTWWWWIWYQTGFSTGWNKHEAHYLMMKMLERLSANTESFCSEHRFWALACNYVVNREEAARVQLSWG